MCVGHSVYDSKLECQGVLGINACDAIIVIDFRVIKTHN